MRTQCLQTILSNGCVGVEVNPVLNLTLVGRTFKPQTVRFVRGCIRW